MPSEDALLSREPPSGVRVSVPVTLNGKPPSELPAEAAMFSVELNCGGVALIVKLGVTPVGGAPV